MLDYLVAETEMSGEDTARSVLSGFTDIQDKLKITQ